MGMLEAAESYGEYKRWNWGENICMNQSQSSRELAFPSSGIEEPGKHKEFGNKTHVDSLMFIS